MRKKNLFFNRCILFTVFIFFNFQPQFEISTPETGMHKTHTESMTTEFTKAICVIHPTSGNKVTGIVTFTKQEDGIKVVADLQNLPQGSHGFHIHEFGDCSSADGSSAGGHFNPDGMNHGAMNDSVRHVGDFGNIEADANGNAHKEFVDTFISFFGPHSIIGRGIIVHEKADDLKTQPTGNAGGRLGCGVIGISK